MTVHGPSVSTPFIPAVAGLIRQDTHYLQPPFIVDGRVDTYRRNKFFKAVVRIHGGFNTNEHNTIITTIQADVNTLRENVKTANKLVHSRGARKLKDASPSSWASAREHSKRLHGVLTSTFFSKFCPSHEHLAQVRLKAPSKKQVGYSPCDSLACSFMLQHRAGEDGVLPWEYRHVHITPYASE